MFCVRVRSTAGNRLLMTAGVTYVAAGAVLLALLVRDAWGTSGLIDKLLQVVLAGVVAFGVWLALNSMRNLGIAVPLPRRRHHA